MTDGHSTTSKQQVLRYGAIAAAIVLFGEAFLASQVIGKILDRTDVSAIDAQE